MVCGLVWRSCAIGLSTEMSGNAVVFVWHPFVVMQEWGDRSMLATVALGAAQVSSSTCHL